MAASRIEDHLARFQKRPSPSSGQRLLACLLKCSAELVDVLKGNGGLFNEQYISAFPEPHKSREKELERKCAELEKDKKLLEEDFRRKLNSAEHNYRKLSAKAPSSSEIDRLNKVADDLRLKLRKTEERLGDRIRDNFRQAAVSGAGGLTENLSNPIRASKLAEVFQDLYSQDRMNFIDSLGYGVSEEETDLAIIECLEVGYNAAVNQRQKVESNVKHVLGVKDKDTGANSYSAIDLAIKEYLSKHASGMSKSMNKVESAINEKCSLFLQCSSGGKFVKRIAWFMWCACCQSPPVQLVFDDITYTSKRHEREYNSSRNSRHIKRVTWPVLSQMDYVLSKGHVVTESPPPAGRETMVSNKDSLGLFRRQLQDREGSKTGNRSLSKGHVVTENPSPAINKLAMGSMSLPKDSHNYKKRLKEKRKNDSKTSKEPLAASHSVRGTAFVPSKETKEKSHPLVAMRGLSSSDLSLNRSSSPDSSPKPASLKRSGSFSRLYSSASDIVERVQSGSTFTDLTSAKPSTSTNSTSNKSTFSKPFPSRSPSPTFDYDSNLHRLRNRSRNLAATLDRSGERDSHTDSYDWRSS